MSKYGNRVAKLSGLAVLALVAIGTTRADALLIWNGTSPAPNDSTSWGGLGPDGTTIASGFTATSTGGVTITGSFAAGLSGLTSIQCPAAPSCSWTGGFPAGDHLIWTLDGTGVGSGSLTLGFAKAVLAGGLEIQADSPGAFTAQVEAFNGGTLLGTEILTSANGAPIFIGAQDTTADITSLVFDLTACTPTGGCDVHDFAVDTLLSINPGVTPPPAPEPGTLALLGSSLLGFAALRRRRRQ
jgi:hypothetical protein